MLKIAETSKMRRCENNPVVKRTDIPDIAPELIDATSVFNPGAIKLFPAFANIDIPFLREYFNPPLHKIFW